MNPHYKSKNFKAALIDTFKIIDEKIKSEEG